MVHKDGIEPPTRAPSTRRSTSELLVRNGAAGGKSNPSSPRWQRGALPLSYGRELVGRDGFEPPQNERRFYRALGSPVPSLPEIGCRGGSRIRLEQLMRLPGSRTSLREIGGEPTCRSPWLAPLTRFERGSGAALIDSPWRKAVVLIHNACASNPLPTDADLPAG
jgi:hypothetical protein